MRCSCDPGTGGHGCPAQRESDGHGEPLLLIMGTSGSLGFGNHWGPRSLSTAA